jgi:hypothetical protein
MHTLNSGVNALLMLGDTFAALPVLARVWFTVEAASLGLNLVRRGRTVTYSAPHSSQTVAALSPRDGQARW